MLPLGNPPAKKLFTGKTGLEWLTYSFMMGGVTEDYERRMSLDKSKGTTGYYGNNKDYNNQLNREFLGIWGGGLKKQPINNRL